MTVGLSPREVDRLTAWEFYSAVEGWRRANCPEDGEDGSKPPTEEEHDALMARFS